MTYKIFHDLAITNHKTFESEAIMELFNQLCAFRVDPKFLIPNVWFYADLSLQEIQNSENFIDFPIDQILKGSGYIYVCRIYDIEKNISLPPILNHFDQFIAGIKKIPGVKSVQLFLMKNIEVLAHQDGSNNNIKRILFPLDIPNITDVDKIGIKVAEETIIPVPKKLIIFDGSAVHSAWNYSNYEWKFLSIDIVDEDIV